MREIKLMLDLGEDIEEDALPEELRGMLVDEDDDEDPDVDLEDLEGSEEEGDELALDDDDLLPDLMGGESEEDEDLQETFEISPKMLRQELARARKAMREGKMDHHFGKKGFLVWPI